MFSQAFKGLRCKALENAVRLLYQSRGPGTRCRSKFCIPLANVKNRRRPASVGGPPAEIYASPSRRAPFATSRQTSMPMTVGTAKETAVHLRLWVSL